MLAGGRHSIAKGTQQKAMASYTGYHLVCMSVYGQQDHPTLPSSHVVYGHVDLGVHHGSIVRSGQ